MSKISVFEINKKSRCNWSGNLGLKPKAVTCRRSATLSHAYGIVCDSVSCLRDYLDVCHAAARNTEWRNDRPPTCLGRIDREYFGFSNEWPGSLRWRTARHNVDKKIARRRKSAGLGESIKPFGPTESPVQHHLGPDCIRRESCRTYPHPATSIAAGSSSRTIPPRGRLLSRLPGHRRF